VFFRLYLNALHEELLALLTSINMHKPVSAAPEVEEREVSHPSPSEVGKRGLTVR
jgi:hypothetical protein